MVAMLLATKKACNFRTVLGKQFLGMIFRGDKKRLEATKTKTILNEFLTKKQLLLYGSDR